MAIEFSPSEKDAMRLALKAETSKVQKKPVSTLPPIIKPTPKPLQPTTSATPSAKQSKFGDLESVTVSLSCKPKPWKDTETKNIKITDVSQLGSTEAIAIGMEVVEAIMAEKVTSSTIDQILSLAISLYSPSSTSTTPRHILTALPENMGNRIRTSECSLTSTSDREAKKIQEKLMKVRAKMEKEDVDENKKGLRTLEAKLNQQLNNLDKQGLETADISNADDAYAYTYMAAYIMRLSGKTASAWADKYEMAKTRFNSWYDCESSVLSNIEFTEDQAEKIREGMARRPDCISTWVLWAAYNENDNKGLDQNDSGILRYLVTQMYSYTGMHAYSSIMQLQIEHNVSFKFLLDELNCPATRKAVYEVADIIRNHEITELNSNRKTYFRYARVWDSGYFVNLQSKNCAVLGYTVAKARKMLSSSSAVSDPTQAYAFKNIDAKLKTSLDDVADRLYDKIMAQSTQDEESGSIWSKN